MSLGTRLSTAVVLLGALVLAGLWLTSGEGGSTAAATTRWESARNCRSCHQEIYDEWYGSHHRIAYTNPEVRALSEDFRKKECQDCHLPRPVSVTGFGKRTLPRLTNLDEGVSCLSCHLAPDGGLFGRRDLPNAPCRPRANAEFVSIALCESCHNQHGTTDQWRASSYPAAGTECNDCHMPEVERTVVGGDTRSGFRHVYEGAHDLATLRGAGRFDAGLDDGALLLSLENIAAGHNFPTEERHRAVDMLYRFELADGSMTDWTRAWRFRQPYRDETGENTQLPAGETKAVRVPVPEGATRAWARLWYRLAPYIDDEDPKSTLLEEKEVALQ